MGTGCRCLPDFYNMIFKDFILVKTQKSLLRKLKKTCKHFFFLAIFIALSYFSISLSQKHLFSLSGVKYARKAGIQEKSSGHRVVSSPTSLKQEIFLFCTFTHHKLFFSICFWCNAFRTGENKNAHWHRLVEIFSYYIALLVLLMNACLYFFISYYLNFLFSFGWKSFTYFWITSSCHFFFFSHIVYSSETQSTYY